MFDSSQRLDRGDDPDRLQNSDARHESGDDSREKGEDMSEEMLILSSKNRSIFKRLTDRAKKTARNIIRSVKDKIPGKADVCAKAQIVTNELYTHRHERIQLHWGKEVEAIQMQIDALQASAKSIQGQIDDFRKRKIPGVDDMILSKRTIEMQIHNLETQKDKYQSKYEAEQDKMIIGANERNRIASEVIRRCKDKMEPFERDLETLEKRKKSVDLAGEKLEAKHAERKKDLDDLEERKTALENALMMGNKSREEVKRNPSVKAIEKMIASGHKEMQKQKADLLRLRNEIDSQIAEVGAQAAPTRDKLFRYSRIKEEAPITNENVKDRDRKVHNLPPLPIRPRIG